MGFLYWTKSMFCRLSRKHLASPPFRLFGSTFFFFITPLAGVYTCVLCINHALCNTWMQTMGHFVYNFVSECSVVLFIAGPLLINILKMYLYLVGARKGEKWALSKLVSACCCSLQKKSYPLLSNVLYLHRFLLIKNNLMVHVWSWDWCVVYFIFLIRTVSTSTLYYLWYFIFLLYTLLFIFFPLLCNLKYAINWTVVHFSFFLCCFIFFFFNM